MGELMRSRIWPLLTLLLIGCSPNYGLLENAIRRVNREAAAAGRPDRIRLTPDGRVEKYSLGAISEVNERWIFEFDDRNWRIGYQSSDSKQAIREYVLNGETVDNWTQLVTSHFVVAKESFEAMVKTVTEALKRKCPSSRVSVIEQSHDSVIIEWQSPPCGNEPPQHEIRRLKPVYGGLLSLAYVQKTRELSADRRNSWLSILHLAKVAPDQLYTLGDGSSFRHPLGPNGFPFAAENRLAEVVIAGPYVEQGQSSDKRAQAFWAFELAMKTGSIKRLVITDVTDKDFRVLVSETRPKIEKGRVKTRSSVVLVSPTNTPWVYNSEATTKIFRLDIEDDNGTTESLFQPSYVPAFEKRNFQSVVENINKKAGK